MAYQPFLIAPFATGLDNDKAPWILPQDAFVNIENGHIKDGTIEKRLGYQFLGDMVHGREITLASNGTPAQFTVLDATGITDGDTVTLHYLAGGNWANLNGAKYTINGLAGLTFNLLDTDGNAVDGALLGAYTPSSGRLGTFPQKRMMGIFRYIGSDNTRELLVSDTERVAIYNATSELFEPLDLYDSTGALNTDSDVWASSNLDYIVAANWQHAGSVNRVYFTNGKAAITGPPGTDGIVLYDSTSAQVEQFRPSLNTTDTLYGCKFLFSIKQRLVCLHTFEFNGATTNTFPQRARWCKGQNPAEWNDATPGGGGYVDAPTGEQIISAKSIQDQIIVQFTDSVWTLRPVSDPALPFRWDKINDFRSCDAKMGTVGYDRYVVAIGQRGITATDGVETRRVDDRIKGFSSDEINQDEYGKVFAARSYQNERTWFLYPEIESDESNASLIYDDGSASYSKYIFSNSQDMNVLGYGNVSKDYAAEDFIAANGLDVSADDESIIDADALSFFWSSNAELFLGGDRLGAVHTLEYGGTDNGSPISFYLESAGWNPYKEQGSEAQFGYIDLYLDSDQNTRLSIDFLKDDSLTKDSEINTAYVTRSLNLLPNLNYRASCSEILPNADPTTGFVVYSNSHGLEADDRFYIYGVNGADFFNNEQWIVDSSTENSISVDSDITSFGNAITNITQANPGVVTSVGHSFQNSDVIYVTDVTGMTEINGNDYEVANKTDDTFELLGVNTTTYTAYAGPSGYAFKSYLGGGEIVERKFYRTKVWKRAYAGGIGYVHNIKIRSEGANKPLKIHAFRLYFRPRGRRVLG